MSVEPANASRLLIAAVAEACERRNIALRRMCHDWLLLLEQRGARRTVLGYHFQLNPDPPAAIARDKAATAELLAADDVAHVPHALLLSPRLAAYTGGGSNADRVAELARRRGWPLVVKPNEGTGGGGVRKVHDTAAVEAALQGIFERGRAAVVSPWVSIQREVRCVLLDDEPLLVYEKQPPYVVGDGKSDVQALLAAALADRRITPAVAAAALGEADLAHVPAAGQRSPLLWRHNLRHGATPIDVPDADRFAALARKALSALELRLAAVDIIARDDGALSVLEVNGGIMLEAYAQVDDAHRARAAAVYDAIVTAMFERCEAGPGG